MRGALATAASLILAALGSLSPAFAADPPPAPPKLEGNPSFPLDSELEPRVRFWVDIYMKYHSWETLVVYLRSPQLVFSVSGTREHPASAAAEKRKVAAALHRLAEKWERLQAGKLKREKLPPAELRALEALEREQQTSLLPALAADPRLLRAQSGLRDSLEDALFASGKYLARMESVFTRFQLPPEIAYLPFVESGFNKHAVSKVGASGIWQFMPYTGKLYLRVDEVVDERNDPMRAAEAAARLMKQNYQLLGDWPLAITAYNHGTAGIAKAARETGSRRLAEIIPKYENANFGFASQNFYASFLAALHVAKNSETYLGMVPRARKLEFDEFVMPDFMALGDFTGRMGIDETVFRELNPALTEEVYNGNKRIPVGYTVRVPTEASAGFLPRYEALPAELKFREQKRDETVAGSGFP
jgi:membrane-bound lytic murein transglycosylase D